MKVKTRNRRNNQMQRHYRKTWKDQIDDTIAAFAATQGITKAIVQKKIKTKVIIEMLLALRSGRLAVANPNSSTLDVLSAISEAYFPFTPEVLVVRS